MIGSIDFGDDTDRGYRSTSASTGKLLFNSPTVTRVTITFAKSGFVNSLPRGLGTPQMSIRMTSSRNYNRYDMIQIG